MSHARGTPPSCIAVQLVFALVSVGAIVLTVNVVLLGGTIGFFQSLCLLGYCLFPLDVAAIVCVTTDILLIRQGLAAGLPSCTTGCQGSRWLPSLLPCTLLWHGVRRAHVLCNLCCRRMPQCTGHPWALCAAASAQC